LVDKISCKNNQSDRGMILSFYHNIFKPLPTLSYAIPSIFNYIFIRRQQTADPRAIALKKINRVSEPLSTNNKYTLNNLKFK